MISYGGCRSAALAASLYASTASRIDSEPPLLKSPQASSGPFSRLTHICTTSASNFCRDGQSPGYSALLEVNSPTTAGCTAVVSASWPS